MSRNALIFEKALSAATAPVPLHPVPSPGEYVNLIRRVLRDRSVLAVIGAGSGSRSSEACRGIAAELGGSGKRVVIARIHGLLLAGRPPAASASVPGRAPNVWIWPSPADAGVEFFPSPDAPEEGSDWLGSLRRAFDAVLLDCPPPGVAPDAIEIAAMAEAAILVAEAGRTTRQQVRWDHRALELAGIRLAGCVLMERR
jgi:hypothetical protein